MPHVHVGPGEWAGDPPPPLPPLPPAPPPPPPPAGPRRGGRVRKGDVRATLLALLADGPRNGYQLIRAIAERSGGTWRPSPGSVYPTLAQLAEEGLLTTTGAGRERRCHLTERGRAAAAAAADAPPAPAFAPPAAGVPELTGAYERLRAAVTLLVEDGTPDQRAHARRLLDAARRDLYRILADDLPAAADPPAGDHPDTGRPAAAFPGAPAAGDPGRAP
ncbi:hypothetical protein GCM10010123_22940 [Pilimelia anulata]|uniref:Transcription regulator PadR N-terminal domain-containing protein n=1 Tax=Pilimelia anulata TaxID=53371 RepID=A0A8J3B704_9ACTN|nr:PadR family transcriptional regulator [Pilimelia anulata]GGJ92474.1 hypothetical protein GCM10010123_22940 [Pilimelia anulata]